MGIRDAWRALWTVDGSQGIDEAAPSAAPVQPSLQSAAGAASRHGYDTDVPYGGAGRLQPGGDYPDGRQSFMQSLYVAYTSCPWMSAPIDAIARTVTAGGLRIAPTTDAEDGETPAKPPRQVKALQDLLDFCNPYQDVIQLLRGLVTDLGIYGDAFLEVVWLLGRPVALYALDPASMIVEADEHGVVSGYMQVVDSREQHFEPREVIHIPMDAPKGSLYGMGIGQKAMLPVTTWLFAAALIKERMKRGDPPNLHLDFPLEVQPSEVREWRGQYQVKNLGTANIGNPTTTRGGVTASELQKGTLADGLAILDSCRDTILSVAGVPPSKVGVIESGSIGGGTGGDQDKTFRVNTCGPIASIVLEKLNFHLAREAFGIDGWELSFAEVDWRDDTVVEDIRDKRLRNGTWTLNDALADMGKPTLGPEGDIHVLITTKELLTWDVVEAYSAATVAAAQVKVDQAQASADAAAALAANPAMHRPPPGQPGGHPMPEPASSDDGAAPGDKQQPPGAKQPEEASAWRGLVAEHYRRLVGAGRS